MLKLLQLYVTKIRRITMAKRKTKQERATEAQLEIEKEITSVPTEQNSTDKDEPIHSSLENRLKKYVRPLRRL